MKGEKNTSSMYYNGAQSGQYCNFFLSSCFESYKLKFAKTHSFQIEQNLKKKIGEKAIHYVSECSPIAEGVSCEKKRRYLQPRNILVSFNQFPIFSTNIWNFPLFIVDFEFKNSVFLRSTQKFAQFFSCFVHSLSM